MSLTVNCFLGIVSIESCLHDMFYRRYMAYVSSMRYSIDTLYISCGCKFEHSVIMAIGKLVMLTILWFRMNANSKGKEGSSPIGSRHADLGCVNRYFLVQLELYLDGIIFIGH
jgi:hypothetical protein